MEERVVRVAGGRVRRPVHGWTPTVQTVLRRLRAAGLTAAPLPLVVNDSYEEVSWLPGQAGAACWPHQATESGLRSAARLLRRVHDATAGWEPPGDAVWAVEPVEPHEVVCHGDPGPWNMTWVDGEAVGLFDWDFCHPGPRREDVAYALEYLAPFRSDADALRWHGFTRPPDRAARIASFCDAYGLDPEGIVDAVVDGQRRTIDRVRALADAGVEPQATWITEGYLDDLAARVAWSEDYRDLVT